LAVAAEPRVATLLAEPHHDGSDAYVAERPDRPGANAVVRLRVPRGTAVDQVGIRYVRDGEARVLAATLDAETETETWWRASLPALTNGTRYRWLLSGGDFGYAWLNGLGILPHEVADADDFVLSLDRGGPDWHLGSVVYQIYPDRFATTGLDVEAPGWAVRRAWDELPTGRGRKTAHELYGGDLFGVEAHLDHVESLGANVIYMTPFFPAGSQHRYDATTFDRVDPLLGGDEALAALLCSAHARGIRVLGDLTTNHTGVGHDWFTAREPFYYFDDSLPYGYESWFGVRSLPKLNWGSDELRRRMLAVARRWLDFGLDGWRIDVANMTGRLHGDDANADVARALRGVLEDDELLVAEQFHDFRADVAPGLWHGVMNYSGFLKPAWSWLRGPDAAPQLDLPVELPRFSGEQSVASMRAFRAGVPWHATLHSWPLLDSHDVARFRSVAGSRERHLVGVGLQMTTPGVPMVFAGDELGLAGNWGEDGRRTMPWDRPEAWDRDLLEGFRKLIALRRTSPALARGGIRYAYVDADVISYLREAEGERLLCLASRSSHTPVALPLALLGCLELEPVTGAEAAVEDGRALLPAEGPEFHVWRIHG
jgi:alpha-glucosidase